MSNINSESLFSLEIVVNKLKLNENIICRFPSIACKLLDFPTLFIPYLQPQYEEIIRKNICTNPTNVIPIQFPQFLDIDRAFVFLRGKSSLFKSTASQLLEDLRTAPLFIMVIDCFEDKPRLVGNGRIVLEDIMMRLYGSIEICGHSLPVFEGEKDIFPIYNLLGKMIGSIDIGYRILSLGSTLFQHIPELQKIDETNDSHDSILKLDNFWKDTMNQDHELILEPIFSNQIISTDVDNSSTQVHNAANSYSPKYVNKNVETINKIFLNTSVQTKSIQTKRSKTFYLDNITDISNPILSNLDNPPPLFYNSNFEEKNKLIESSAISYTNINEPFYIDDYNYNEDINLVIKSSNIDKVINKQKAVEVKKTKEVNSNNYPILRALFSEIMRLQKEPFPFEESINGNIETFDNNLKKSPSLEQKHPFSHHCVHNQKRLSRNQSWLKPYKKGKFVSNNNCFITPGLTKTQKLRLKEKNPEVLKKAIKIENDRLLEWRKKFDNMQNKSLGNGNFEAMDNNENICKNIPNTFKKPIPTPRLSIKDSNSHKQLINQYLKNISVQSPNIHIPYQASDIRKNVKSKQELKKTKNKVTGQDENSSNKNNLAIDIQLEQYIDPLSAFYEDTSMNLKKNDALIESNKKKSKHDIGQNILTKIENYIIDENILNISKLSEQSILEKFEEFSKINESTGSQLTDETDTNTAKTVKISKQSNHKKPIEFDKATSNVLDNKNNDIRSQINPAINQSNIDDELDLNHFQRYIEAYSSDTEGDLLDHMEIHINKSTDSENNSVNGKDSISSLPIKSKTTKLNNDNDLGLKESKKPYKKQERGILRSDYVKTPRTSRTINSVSFTTSYSQSFENFSGDENDVVGHENDKTSIHENLELSMEELDFVNQTDNSEEYNTNSNNNNESLNNKQLFLSPIKMTTKNLGNKKFNKQFNSLENKKAKHNLLENSKKISNTDSYNIDEITDIAGMNDLSMLSDMNRSSSGCEIVKQLTDIKLDENALFAYTWHFK